MEEERSNMAFKKPKQEEQKEALRETKKEVAKLEAKQQELANIGPADYYEEYGRQASSRPIVGKLLKFSKGDYLAGQDNEEFEEGTELVACMDTLQVGWVKWVDSSPVDQRMGLLMEGHKPEKRGELGDSDEDQWEVDEQSGKPRDPWQFANQLILRPLDWSGEDDELYTFVTQSKGGVSAIGNLCKYYGREMRQRPGDYPVIKLEVDSYMHSNKQFGRIKVPLLTPTEDWVAKDPVTKRKAPAKPDAKGKGSRRAA